MEVFRALAALVEVPAAEHARLAGLLGLPATPTPDEHADLFLFNLYPYASVYTGDEGMIGGEAQDRAAGMWRALKLTPPSDPDHLAVLLPLYATIAEREIAEDDPARRALWRNARKACLWEQIACWLFPYLDKMDEIAPPPYRAWGGVLRDAVNAEIAVVGPSDALPAHLRHARPLPSPTDPEAGADDWLGALLAPARSGMILTRVDLARAADDLALGLRAGERRFALRAMLSQDAARVIDWLRREALAWADRHVQHMAATGAIASHWETRARATASSLEIIRPAAWSQS
jgi:TorA maturation chaperone TorD